MNTRNYILISIATFTSGVLFFTLYNQWIVFRTPWNTHYMLDNTAVIQKKEVIHYYFHADKWKVEKQELLWTDNAAKNIFQLINAWLTLLDEEHITAKKITLQSVLISTSGCAYLSFDHTFLGKEETMFKKWMIIEGLLKTIILNNITISHVQFLVQHQLLQDSHLDFSLSWPVHGFMNKQ